MATVPTGDLDEALRVAYSDFIIKLTRESVDIDKEMDLYLDRVSKAIKHHGGSIVARATTGFTTPTPIDLDEQLAPYRDKLKAAIVKGGITAGLNANEIASALVTSGVSTIHHDMARLARTEVVAAYWQDQWKEAEELDLVMVWSAEDGPRTCPYCLAKNGLVVEDKTIRDHPNGRCTLVPTLPELIPPRTKDKDPRWTRNHDPEGYHLPSNPVVNQALRGSVEQVLVRSRATQGALNGMVSQGWTVQDALRYMLSYPGMKTELTGKDLSLTYRTLERLSQELWDKLEPYKGPRVLYRGGDPNPLGMSSWTSDEKIARLYAIRNRQSVYKTVMSSKVLSLFLGAANPEQNEYLVWGMPRIIPKSSGKILSTIMYGYNTLVTVEQALETL